MTVEIEMTLPWPHADLSPNGRAHWARKSRAVKNARRLAWGVTLEALGRHRLVCNAVALHWDFHPKTANLPDGDNAEASVKAYRDGIADALGIDDAKFTATRTIGQPVKGGAVKVAVRAA